MIPPRNKARVTVDVELLGELPRGARPDRSVDGTIELDVSTLWNVLSVGRPLSVRNEHCPCACSS